MKKYISLLICLLFVVNANSQINNLSDFLKISNLTTKEVVQELQYSWKMSKPTEKIKGELAVSEYVFSFVAKKQILKRKISLNLKTIEKIESTTFISTDYELLTRITKSLPYKEFVLVGNEVNKQLYDDGYNLLMIELNFKKIKGLYGVTIVSKLAFENHREEIKEEIQAKRVQDDEVKKNEPKQDLGSTIPVSKKDNKINELIQGTDIAAPVINTEKEERGGGYGNRGYEEDKINLNRKVISKPKPYLPCNEKETVTLIITVDSKGNPKRVKLSNKSRSSNQCVISSAFKFARRCKWEEIKVDKNEKVKLEVDFN